MSYLEELLPEFRKGAKIRCDYWDKGQYIQLKEDGYIYDDKDDRIEVSNLTIFGKSWELYKKPEPDWDYIIEKKCLCWFWDNIAPRLKDIGILESVLDCDCKPYVADNGKSYDDCRPVRRDEVTFYEDIKR